MCTATPVMQKRLYIKTGTEVEFVFTVGSDKVLVNGKEQKLAEPFKTVDGLPEVPLFWLYKATDTRYIVEGKSIETFTADGPADL